MEKQAGGVVRRALLNSSEVHPHWEPLQRAVKREAATERLSTPAPSSDWLRHVVTTAIRPRERRDRTGRSSARSGDSGDSDPASDRPASDGASA